MNHERSDYCPRLCAGRRGSARGQAPVPKKLLFLTHAGLYKHTSLGPAEKAVAELGARHGFEVTTLEGYKQDLEQVLDLVDDLGRVSRDGSTVLMLMTQRQSAAGRPVQKKAVVDYVRGAPD